MVIRNPDKTKKISTPRLPVGSFRKWVITTRTAAPARTAFRPGMVLPARACSKRSKAGSAVIFDSAGASNGPGTPQFPVEATVTPPNSGPSLRPMTFCRFPLFCIKSKDRLWRRRRSEPRRPVPHAHQRTSCFGFPVAFLPATNCRNIQRISELPSHSRLTPRSTQPRPFSWLLPERQSIRMPFAGSARRRILYGSACWRCS